MENMKEAKAIQSLDEITLILKNELEDIAEGFIAVGYYLKKTRDDELYRQKGYKNIFEYAQDTFGISRFTATRFMEVNDRYSIGGYSPQIEDRYRGYGSSKLTEMLQLPEDIREAVPQEATVRDIREAKAIIRETEKRYDSQMELCDIAQEEQEETEWLEELVKHLFKNDCREKFKEFVIWLKSPQISTGVAEDILVLINPTKFKMVRLLRANAILQEEGIQILPYRNQGDRKKYTYIEFAKVFESIFFPDGMERRNAELAYEEVYGELLYPKPQMPEKPENTKCGGQSERKKDEESEKARKKEDKVPEKPENTKCEGDSERKEDLGPEMEIKTGEKPENAKCEGVSEAIPGQMDVENDFSEYCPENSGDKLEEEPAAGCPYKIRLEYLKTLSVEEHARYMAENMRIRWKGLSFQQLTEEGFWQRWLTCLVDETGRKIEEG